jgi:hypothetical protein
MNYLIIKSIRQYGEFYNDHLKVECPTGSGNMMNLEQVADELTRRLVCLFERNGDGLRPSMGEYGAFYAKPENSGLLLFHEYFHGDTGKGLGASHQTGWTALIADLVEDLVKAESTSRIHSGT